MPVIHGEEVVHHAGGETPPGAGPFPFDNITISEHQETASEETESPGLDSRYIKLPMGQPVQSALWVRRIHLLRLKRARTKVTIPSPTQEEITLDNELTLDMPVTELLRRMQADLLQTRNTIRLTQAEIHSLQFS